MSTTTTLAPHDSDAKILQLPRVVEASSCVVFWVVVGAIVFLVIA